MENCGRTYKLNRDIERYPFSFEGSWKYMLFIVMIQAIACILLTVASFGFCIYAVMRQKPFVSLILILAICLFGYWSLIYLAGVAVILGWGI